ncbi:MAG: hypothetical protein JSR19_09450 [Proteobacteria bacterium]|nr:hypothetical protein [Pseudomonadota bacterium]HQR04122.1 hypothetical protein [Rhodocyclaceae bacterium]
MITRFDDFCIHQTCEPIAQPASSDRNFYDRYWASGFDTGGGFMFELAFGLYPNRRVMDAHFGVLIDGVQHCFHGSRRAPEDRSELVVGPLSLQILEPLRSFRLVIAPNDTGIACDLHFSARTHPEEEPRSMLYDDGRLMMNTTRFTQLGRWQGHIVLHGRRIEVDVAHTLGARDKSWGIRPVGEPEGGAPSRELQVPRVYWIWAPLDFGHFATQFNTFENADGSASQLGACRMPAGDDVDALPAGGIEAMPIARHRIDWAPGTRFARTAHIDLTDTAGRLLSIELEPLLRFHVMGVGYHHPEWGHGVWKGELVIAGETLEVDTLPALDHRYVHVHQMVRATANGQVGYGTLETFTLGAHQPSGFTAFLDGAVDRNSNT